MSRTAATPIRFAAVRNAEGRVELQAYEDGLDQLELVGDIADVRDILKSFLETIIRNQLERDSAEALVARELEGRVRRAVRDAVDAWASPPKLQAVVQKMIEERVSHQIASEYEVNVSVSISRREPA